MPEGDCLMKQWKKYISRTWTLWFLSLGMCLRSENLWTAKSNHSSSFQSFHHYCSSLSHLLLYNCFSICVDEVQDLALFLYDGAGEGDNHALFLN